MGEESENKNDAPERLQEQVSVLSEEVERLSSEISELKDTVSELQENKMHIYGEMERLRGEVEHLNWKGKGKVKGDGKGKGTGKWKGKGTGKSIPCIVCGGIDRNAVRCGLCWNHTCQRHTLWCSPCGMTICAQCNTARQLYIRQFQGKGWRCFVCFLG